MKLDLYNNHEVYIQERKQDQAIERWCRLRGIPVGLISGHAHFSDVVFLIDIYTEFEQELKRDPGYIATFNAYWGVVYQQKKPLKPRAYIKFEIIVTGCLRIRAEQQLIQQRIKSLRTGTSH
jgi:hypothetical protein